MSKTTLNAVTVDVLAQYGLAGKYLVEAYRVGTQRAIAQLDSGYATLVNSPSLPMVDESFRKSLVAAHSQFTGFLVGGVTRATQQADLAIDRVSEIAATGIQRLASVGDRAEAMVGTPVVESMSKAQLPIARMSLQIAGQMVAGTKRLVEQVGTVENVVAAAAAAQPKARSRRAAA